MSKDKNNSFAFIGAIIAAITIVLLAFSAIIPTEKLAPDNAKFYVDEQARIMVPAPPQGSELFYPALGHRRSTENFDRMSTWSKLKGTSYKLPTTGGWENYRLHGPEITLLRVIFSGYPKRWTSDGRWKF